MQTNWLWGFDQFINDITTSKGESMKVEAKESTVSTQYIHQRLWDILNYSWETELAISDLMDELAENYGKDTGKSIWGDEE